MIDWCQLPRDINNKIKLKNRYYTLADVLDSLIDLDSYLVRYVTQSQFDSMIERREGIDVIDPYIALPIYKTVDDKRNQKLVYMVYGNHGELFFMPYEILEEYVLDDPLFFWDYQLSGVVNMPHNGKHAVSYTFSTDIDAFSQWHVALNYDEIFEAYGFDGGGEKGCLMGFFFIR
jgi:hypothetical protein